MIHTGSIDFASPCCHDEIFVRMQDENSHLLTYSLYDDGEAFNLSGKTVNFYAQRQSDGAVFFLPCVISGSTASIALTGPITAKTDVLRCEFCVIGEDFAMTSPGFTMHVKAIVRDDGAIESTDCFTALELALQAAMQLPEPERINAAVAALDEALLQIEYSGIADRMVGVPKTSFFEYYTEHSRNLFDQIFSEDTVLDQTDGTTDFETDRCVSGFIDLYDYPKLFISRSDKAYFDNNVTVCWYNSAMQFISSVTVSAENSAQRTVTHPLGATYMRFCVYSEDVPSSGGIMVYGLENAESIENGSVPDFVEYDATTCARICDQLLSDMFEDMLESTLDEAKHYADRHGPGGEGGAAIDDTAGNGDTAVTWSADKLYNSFSDCLTDVSTDDLDDFPDYSAQSTRGKVLTVGSDGSLGWQTPAGSGAAIDDTAGDGDTDVTWSADKLYHSFSDCLTDVSTDDLDDFPDYSAQSTRGKVLTVGSDGSLGWQTPAGGGAAIDDTAGDGDTDVTWSADKLSGLQGKPAAVAKNLSVADWANNTLTVSVTGVTASSLVQVTPAPDSISAWTQCGVYCHSQTNGTLTFKCADQPDVLLTANIVIWG